MKRPLRYLVALGLGFTLGLSASAPASTSADKRDKAQFPRTMPAAARTVYTEALSNDDTVTPNVYVSYYYDTVMDEYVLDAQHYDPNSQYGWTDCGRGECGRIVVGRGNMLRISMLSTETLSYSYYGYSQDLVNYKTPGLTVANDWNAVTRIPFVNRTTWMGKRYTLDLNYAGAGFYSSAFPTPPSYGG